MFFSNNLEDPMGRILDGLMKDGRRRITLPSDLAFGDQGLAPYIPKDASIILDISLYGTAN